MSGWKNHGRYWWPYRWLVELFSAETDSMMSRLGFGLQLRPTSVAHRNVRRIYVLDNAFVLIDGTKNRSGHYGRRRIRNFHLTNEDLNYSDRSVEELVSEHLIDLNSANADQLKNVGLSPETQERLIDNRPYRNKLELVSRMVLSQDEYAVIKDRVSVAKANESVKIA
jgi:hypothetical protein